MIGRLFVVCVSIFIGSCVGDMTHHPSAEPPMPTCGHGCMNGGNCMWPGYGEDYYCHCPDGYTGRFCETKIPNCNLGDTCHHGGRCVSDVGEYYCECDYPFTGYLCETEMKDCSDGGQDSMCYNGGECKTDGDDHWCSCQHPYTGYQCETMMSACESCHPGADACMKAPCQCEGECRDITMCVACMGPYDSDCGHPSEERMDGVGIVQCNHGCKMENFMYEDKWHVHRTCAEEMCWSGCDEGGACRRCCTAEYCNIMPVEDHASAASTFASRVGAILAVATFGFLAFV